MERPGRGPRLIIVCGLPGTGKTTLATAFESRLHAVRLSADDWMEALAQGLTVVVEWGTWGRSERDALRLGARAVGAAVELHYLQAPVDLLFERLQRRARENPPIDRDAVTRWFEIFQPPTPEEMALFDEPLIAAVE